MVIHFPLISSTFQAATDGTHHLFKTKQRLPALNPPPRFQCVLPVRVPCSRVELHKNDAPTPTSEAYCRFLPPSPFAKSRFLSIEMSTLVCSNADNGLQEYFWENESTHNSDTKWCCIYTICSSRLCAPFSLPSHTTQNLILLPRILSSAIRCRSLLCEKALNGNNERYRYLSVITKRGESGCRH